jgi:hypothetical protein
MYQLYIKLEGKSDFFFLASNIIIIYEQRDRVSIFFLEFRVRTHFIIYEVLSYLNDRNEGMYLMRRWSDWVMVIDHRWKKSINEMNPMLL